MNWLRKTLFDTENVEEPKFDAKKVRKVFNAMAFVEIENRKDERSWFAADPDLFYPATIKRIKEVLNKDVYPIELADPATRPEIDMRAAGRLIFTDAKNVSAKGWENALKPKGAFEQSKHAEDLVMRAFALDVARRWFTQALHVQAGGDRTPMGLHILDTEVYLY